MNITKQQCYALVAQARESYKNGGNIAKFLRESLQLNENTPEIIEISYDLQAGSYIEYIRQNTPHYHNYCAEIASYLDKHLDKDDSLLEIGCGEATTTFGVFQKLVNKPRHILGFDISFSRIKAAISFWNYEYEKQFGSLVDLDVTVKFFVADLFSIPLANKSIDVIYTSHSIEPNGDREVEALRNIFRVAKKRILLFEPYFEAASSEGQARMSSHGYIKNIPASIKEAGGILQDIQKIENTGNPLNPTYLFDIEINSEAIYSPSIWVDPITLHPLYAQDDCFYSPISGLVYPVIQNVSCLRPENSIVATRLLDDFDLGD